MSAKTSGSDPVLPTPELKPNSLQQELETAAQVQRSLLPSKICCFPGWEVGFEYQAAGFVSGDYVDLIAAGNEGVHFVLGDVSGKGIAASMLMSHLHATLRALLGQRLPLVEVLEKTSRVFCEISLPAQFATLVLGTAHPNGSVDICNAGHVPVLVVTEAGVTNLKSTALPVGMFCDQSFTSERIKVETGDLLFLYSDGLSETQNEAGEQYGEIKLAKAVHRARNDKMATLLSKISHDVRTFGGGTLVDDRSFLALRHSYE